MKFQELTILLPCHSFEDFPLHHEGDEAEGLLAGWTAMWHPLLLVAAARVPSWCRADSPPDSVANRLLIVPQVSESLLLAGWPARAKSEGALVVRKQTSRPAIVQMALAELDPELAQLSPVLVDDFFALGFAFLLVELLTRQMRYMSSLDEVHFQAETLRAAEAAVQGDVDSARRFLTSCFEVLTEARERFYPAETFLLDLTLVASTTRGSGTWWWMPAVPETYNIGPRPGHSWSALIREGADIRLVGVSDNESGLLLAATRTTVPQVGGRLPDMKTYSIVERLVPDLYYYETN